MITQEIKDLVLWDSFVDKSPQGTIFCKSNWLRLYDAPYRIYGYYKGINLLGGICGFERLNGTIFDSGCRVLLTPFQGVLSLSMPDAKCQAIESKWCEIADNLLSSLKYEHIGIGNNYNVKDMRPFTWLKYNHNVRYTYLVDLSDMEKLWLGLEKETRYEISRNTDKISEQKFEDFDRLYTVTFQRKQLDRPLKTDFLYKLYKTFPSVLIGTQDAMVYFIWDNKRAYYILGASNGTGSSGVLWEGLKRMNELGLKECDLVGCNSRDIGHFKRGFGGKLIPYYCATL